MCSSDLLGAAKVWELFAIYEATRGSLDSTPIKRQQAAERQIEWFMEWLRLVTDDSIQLKWPLAIQGSESSTGQINLRRHWLDAFPSLDDPGQTPLLMSARWVAGSQELANRFLDEADSLMFPSFRTEVDLRYLAAYFRRSLLRIQDATAWNSTSSKIQTEEILKGCQGLLDVLRLVHRHRGLQIGRAHV